jgi:hypothetical protein
VASRGSAVHKGAAKRLDKELRGLGA